MVQCQTYFSEITIISITLVRQHYLDLRPTLVSSLSSGWKNTCTTHILSVEHRVTTIIYSNIPSKGIFVIAKIIFLTASTKVFLYYDITKFWCTHETIFSLWINQIILCSLKRHIWNNKYSVSYCQAAEWELAQKENNNI